MTLKTSIAVLIISVGAAFSSFNVNASPVNKALSECMSCHLVAEPEEAEMTLNERLKRIGPSLYYAGNKYQAAWLQKWLQRPTRLYPAGVYYGHHVVVTDDGDKVIESGLVTHPVLDQQQALDVTTALMKLQAKSELVEAIELNEVKKVSRRMGALNFRKFKGCASCHQDKAGEGGMSGPELYTAFNRFQQAYLISYMQDPLAWEPKSLMPNLGLKQKDVEKLVGYLKTLAEGKP